MATAYTKVQIRRGSESEWKKYNTVLAAGEIGFEEDTYRFKIGQYDREGSGQLYAWNDLDYFGSNFDGQINIDNGDGTPENPGACFNGNIIPCADDTFTIGEAARRWKNVHASQAIQLGDLLITQGPASEATGVDQNFLKVNGDDIATRTELEKKTTENLRLAYPTGDDGLPIPQYLYGLFEVLERELPPTSNIGTQSQFNSWVVEALQHVDEIAHDGNKDEDGNVIIGGPNINIIIGPKPGPGEDPTCVEKVDIYAETTVHCMLDAKKGVKVLGADETHFVKANGTVSNLLPLEQSHWTNLPRL